VAQKKPCDALLDDVVNAVSRFSPGLQSDDVTIVALCENS